MVKYLLKYVKMIYSIMFASTKNQVLSRTKVGKISSCLEIKHDMGTYYREKTWGVKVANVVTPQNGDDDVFFPQLILLKSWEPLSPTVFF